MSIYYRVLIEFNMILVVKEFSRNGGCKIFTYGTLIFKDITVGSRNNFFLLGWGNG